MIDLIRFTMPRNLAPPPDYLGGGDFIGKYHIKNFSILVRQEVISCMGSIAKYYFGENISTLTRKNYISALQNLEEVTGWDLNQASLKELEVSITIPVTKPVHDYLSCFGYKPRYTRRPVEKKFLETVLYTTDERSLIKQSFCL